MYVAMLGKVLFSRGSFENRQSCLGQFVLFHKYREPYVCSLVQSYHVPLANLLISRGCSCFFTIRIMFLLQQGKYVEIQFSRGGQPEGGRISNFLLEKVCIVFNFFLVGNYFFVVSCVHEVLYHFKNCGIILKKEVPYFYTNANDIWESCRSYTLSSLTNYEARGRCFVTLVNRTFSKGKCRSKAP